MSTASWYARWPALAAVASCGLLVPGPAAAQEQPDEPLGYTDTPLLPEQPYRVHDPDRPQPEVVAPGARFSEGAAPPGDAVVLFNGSDLAHWQHQDGSPAGWKVGEGYFEIVPRSGAIRTRAEFGDCQLHLEFATPVEPVSSSQGRGNSGVFFLGRYEIQILDSYRNPTYPDGQAAAIYGQFPPRVNVARPPGDWQTYDIVFEAPRWEGDRLVEKARVTLLHNGVLVHHAQELLGTTVHRQVGSYDQPHPARGPLVLQDHGNPIRFRNVWIRELGAYDRGVGID